MDFRIKLNDFNLSPLQGFEEKLIQGGDTGYYGSNPSQLLTNMEKNGKAAYKALSTTVHHVGDFFRGFWNGVVH